MDLMGECFFTNLTFEGFILKSQVKGVDLKRTLEMGKEISRLKYEGLKVCKGNTCAIENFNKVQYFRSCLNKSFVSIKGFHTGELKLEIRLLAFIVA